MVYVIEYHCMIMHMYKMVQQTICKVVEDKIMNIYGTRNSVLTGG